MSPMAVVTGAGRGIGRAICRRLLDDGWSVVGVVNRSVTEARELDPGDGRLEVVQSDLATQDGVDHVVTAVDGRPLRGVVNNAGIVEFEESLVFDRSLWDRTLSVNLFAPVGLTIALAGGIERGGGVVNIASTDALRGSYSSMAYSASKAALLSVTTSLSNVLGPKGVRVNAVTPGWIATEMADHIAEEASALTPLGRLGQPSEVAACVAWLLSGESTFINGASVVLDGGLIHVDSILLKEAEMHL